MIVVIFLIAAMYLVNHFTKKTQTPKLVIGIVVDQMAYEYIPRYWEKYSDDGFKKLISNGFFCKNANFTHFPTYTAPGHSCIYTGSIPSIHGICGNDWYDREWGRLRYCADDTSVNTVGSFSTEGKMSPASLQVSTITDELRMSNNFKSKVIGIALKDRGGIFPAGKLGNASYWYDNTSKRWVTSTYYMQILPNWVDEFNNKNLPDFYLSKPWNTLLPIEQYTESMMDDNNFETLYNGEEKPVFPHNFPELKYKNPQLLRYSPFGNDLTKDFAIETIDKENLGKNNCTDFLCLSFSSTDYVGHIFGLNSIEMEDTYLRVDLNIAEILKYVDDKIGMEKVLILFTADHGVCRNPGYMKSLNFDAGTFFRNVVLDSVNIYLDRIYKKNNLAIQFINQQVYFDRNLIINAGLNIEEITKNTARYIKENIPGVRNVFTTEDLKSNINSAPYISFFRNGFFEKRCGDVFVNFMPYWIEERIVGAEHGSPYQYDTHVPLVWYGWEIEKGETLDFINMTDVAPTLSVLLNIGLPGGCIGKPIEKVLKK
jgi:predicted AlkP superfamily pyrophosphatase or phosphodiesterase